MLSHTHRGTRGPLIVFLHWLSGSGHAWAGVTHVLAARGLQCVAIDLPGFGPSNAISGFDVRAMRDAVVGVIRTLRVDRADQPWFLAGHSMGGKIAAVVAREAVHGKSGLQGLRGLLLVSPSPPSPEPMEESKRKDLLDQLGESTCDRDKDSERAEKFIQDNTGKLPLDAATKAVAVDDLLRMNRTAFRAWLESGSKEDWSEAVGTLALPALILAGNEESALGPEIQEEVTAPHFTNATVVALKGCGHLAPLERPFEVAELFCTFLANQGITLEAEAGTLGSPFSSLLESGRVSPQTRRVMETRIAENSNWNHNPSSEGDAFRTMRALAERIVPNAGFDVAAAVESRSNASEGDGWRFATLPDDAAALRKGLLSLDIAADQAFGVPFVALHPEMQDNILRRAAAGDLGKGLMGTFHVGAAADAFTANEMKQWFEDMRGEFTKAYMAHPATMERIGFTGFADEGGFTQIQLGQREEFER